MKPKTIDIKIGPVRCALGIHSWQSWLGLSLAATIFIICAVNYSLAFGLALGLGFAAVAVIKLDANTPAGRWGLHILWTAAMMMSMCILAQVMVGRFTMLEIPLATVALNLLCCLTVLALCLLLCGNWHMGITLCTLLLLALAIVNGYVFFFREREFAVLDIYTATTAMKVAGQYNYIPTPFLLCGIASGVILLLSLCCLPRVSLGKPLRLRLWALGLAVAGALGLYFGSLSYSPLRWGNDGSAQNGTYLNFFLGLRDSGVKAPSDYTPEKVQALSEQYAEEAAATGPNILVIMNEAYFDPDIYPNDLNTNIPVTPYWDSLQENAIRGYALASVYGGNTANSEFEFLTGSTMAFLPTGSVPFTQYVQDSTFSLAWILKNYGYTTLGTHNYYARGWSRDTVYPKLGLDHNTFLDDYPQQDLLRGFVSDREQYGYLLQLLDGQTEPAFLFAVTMQNHGGYESLPDTYNHNITLTDMDNAKFEQYLSLLNASDQALRYLLTSLEKRQEKTIVLFFGDHQPKLDASVYEALNGGALDTLPEQMTQHTVPFLIWANYDIEEKDLGLTSLNFLAGHLMDAAGLERSAYQKYLGELEQTIPAMNHLGFYSREQGKFVPYDQATAAEAAALNAYKNVQYNALFDPDNRNDRFFAKYLPEED